MFYRSLHGFRAPVPDCFADLPPIAGEVARGVTRLFCRQDLFAICEVPLPNGRRADMMAIDGKGQLVIVEIKVSRADLLGDGKWTDYLDYCDRFYWAVPSHLASICDEERFLPGEAGLLVADRYDAAIWREAAHRPLAPARRKAELLRFARRAARRLSAQIDPTLGRGTVSPARAPVRLRRRGFFFTVSIKRSISVERRSRSAWSRALRPALSVRVVLAPASISRRTAGTWRFWMAMISAVSPWRLAASTAALPASIDAIPSR